MLNVVLQFAAPASDRRTTSLADRATFLRVLTVLRRFIRERPIAFACVVDLVNGLDELGLEAPPDFPDYPDMPAS